MSKVVSFCLYGSQATYIIGMKENIKLAKKFFNDWEVRIYHNETVPDEYIEEYKEMGANCIFCKNIGKNKMNWEGMFWRWLPLDDDDVDYWISRDADSRLSQREADIVNEWIDSGKTLHVIRDHRCHMHCIMGGLFGINNKKFHSTYKFKTVKQIIKETYSYYKERPYNVDQIFLNDKLWEVTKHDSIAHISNGGRRVFGSDINIPPAKIDFIGKQYRLSDKLIVEQPQINGIDLKDKYFRIKSLYKDYCLDIKNKHVILTKLNENKDSQVWKYTEESHLVHIESGHKLTKHSTNELIISDKKVCYKWSIKEGGFIIHEKSNTAIDIKGGINDHRNETWLFGLNFSEAQQWQFIEVENDGMKQKESTSKNSYFRIKSRSNNKAIDVIDDKVKLSPYHSDKTSQLWYYAQNNKLLHRDTGLPLSFDENNDLELNEDEYKKQQWLIEDDKYLINKSNKKAVDIKGGSHDTRNEVWVFRLNKTPAQEWEILYDGEAPTVKKQEPKRVNKSVIIPDKNSNHKPKKLTSKDNLIQIKSKNVELYFEEMNGQVKLNDLNNKNSQIWKVMDNGTIMNYYSNQFLSFHPKTSDLIVKDDAQDKWKFINEGIMHCNSKKMIDFKGGFSDPRQEAWLFNKNDSDAQKWDIIEITDINKLKVVQETNERKINEFFDQIYIIHLDVLVDRKESIIRQINEFGLKNITIIDAINKNDIDINKLKENELIGYPNNNHCKTAIINKRGDKCWCGGRGHRDMCVYTGRIACALSHYKVYENMLSKGYKKCLVLEDDFLFNPNLHKTFNTIHKDIPHDWEMLYLCNSRFINMNSKQKNYNKSFVMTERGISDAGCYGITNKSAKVLFDNFYPIKAAADGYLGVCIDRLYEINKVYISKRDLSKNGSIDKFKSVNDNITIIQNNTVMQEKLNEEMKKIVTEYTKNDVEDVYEKKDLSKTLLIMDNNYHHKNKKGMEMICEYLNYNLVYGNVKDIPDADVVFCPSRPFDVRPYSDKRFIFGPHLSIFPDNKLQRIHNQGNCVYIQPSPWAKQVWDDMNAEDHIKVESFPFPVEVDVFKPTLHKNDRTEVFVMFKHRDPKELSYIERELNKKGIKFRVFRYGSYKETDYIECLKHARYGIWVGRHESQGFALQEALSCDVPLLVWGVTNMNQQHNWKGCPNVHGTTIPFWDERCGEFFHKQGEFSNAFDTFMDNLFTYKPREFVLNTVSVEQCADNFKRVFLNEYDFDIVIPVGPNDMNVVEEQVKYTKNNVIGARNIYLICKKDLNIEGTTTILEKDFPFDVETVRKYHGKTVKNHWYYQQLLKLYSWKVIPDILDRFLVIDCDTFFIKPTRFLKEGKCLYNYSNEYHTPYFDHMKSLDPVFEKMFKNKSGICHHMLFEVKYVKEIFELIEKRHNIEFYHAFLKCVIPEEFATSGASEYEIYFNYMFKKHPEKVEIRQLKWTDSGKIILNRNYDYVSCHWFYRR